MGTCVICGRPYTHEHPDALFCSGARGCGGKAARAFKENKMLDFCVDEILDGEIRQRQWFDTQAAATEAAKARNLVGPVDARSRLQVRALATVAEFV